MVAARTFKIVKIADKEVVDEGRYHGSSPLQAAKKAFNQHCRNNKAKTCKKTFTVQEITRGGGSKEYHYRGERKKLSSPKEITRGDTTYKVEYETTVKKA
jgi:hypothetical protein